MFWIAVSSVEEFTCSKRDITVWSLLSYHLSATKAFKLFRTRPRSDASNGVVYIHLVKSAIADMAMVLNDCSRIWRQSRDAEHVLRFGARSHILYTKWSVLTLHNALYHLRDI